jgi:hypothetical protein
MTMNKQAVLKRLQQLEQSSDPITLCHVHELILCSELEAVEYSHTDGEKHYWNVPELAKDEFHRVLDRRFDEALAAHFKPQGTVTPLHIIYSAE